MSTLSLRLPNSIHKHAKRLAEEEGISINQLISTAVAEKISALSTEQILVQRAARGSVIQARKILRKVPSRKPDPGDEL